MSSRNLESPIMDEKQNIRLNETTEVSDGKVNDEINMDEIKVEEDNLTKLLLFGVKESPPIQVTIMCALQQGLSSLSSQLLVSLLVAEAVCASNNNVFKAKLLSSTLFMSGITTIAMNVLGIRLPLFQGASASYVVPLLMVSDLDGTFCSGNIAEVSSNLTKVNGTLFEDNMEIILNNVRVLQGSLMAAGVFHSLIGALGIVGILIRFIGPLTIVPTMMLIFIALIKSILKFITASWPITFSTISLSVILFLYLSRYNTIIPIWTPSGGCRMKRYPVHQIFALLISILVNWGICGILTVYDVFPNDKSHSMYNARTDSRADAISINPWVTVPYPGQYGWISISPSVTVIFIIASMYSILDSIGDYHACARVCRVPPPPPHGVNRGIMIEGLCSFLSGAVGCGHATSTYGGNIGAIGVSKVASRVVFIWVGVLYIAFGVFGKFSAVFITIPYPVLGGSFVILIGILFGVIVGSLEITRMSSSRNIAILGLSVCIGLAIPMWAQSVNPKLNTGNVAADTLLSMLLKNPNLAGTLIACFLDNTVPGTNKERGISIGDVDDATLTTYDEGYSVYSPLLPKHVLSWKMMKYIPFLPYRGLKPVPQSSNNI